MQVTMPGAHRQGRPRTAWMDNIKTWTGLSVEESVRMTTRSVINGESTSMVWPTLGSRMAKEQNRTVLPELVKHILDTGVVGRNVKVDVKNFQCRQFPHSCFFSVADVAVNADPHRE